MAAIVTLAGLAGTAAADPVAVAKAFCAAQTSNAAEDLRPLMTADLRAVVEEAEMRNRAIAESGSGVPSPLSAGVPYQSFDHPAETCTPARIATASNLQIIEVRYATPGSEASAWTDRLVLKQEKGELLIDDILFATFPTDTYNAGLRRVLADSFDN